MQDGEIIALFFERSEKAIVALSAKYGRLLHRIAFNILGNMADVEECVNDAYYGIWKAIPPHRPEALLSFACRIVRNVAINRCKHNTVLKRQSNYALCLEELSELLSDPTSVEEGVILSELTDEINAFLADLSSVNRSLFVRRYVFFDGYEEIARSFGLRENAVRTRLSRIKAELKEYLEKRGTKI